jgi:hypothetical protein
MSRDLELKPQANSLWDAGLFRPARAGLRLFQQPYRVGGGGTRLLNHVHSVPSVCQES